MKKPGNQEGAPGAVDLIEEAVHLLRRHPRELTGYYAAVSPFVVALLYFWAYVTWFAPADGAIAAGALLLAALFGLMKAGQRRFALRLLAHRQGETPPTWTIQQWLAETAGQLRAQAAGIVLVPLAALFGVPFGWVYAYFQTGTVMPVAASGIPAQRAAAWEQTKLWPVQNHGALAILAVAWLVIFLNLAVTFYLVPTLATQWLGLKTVFALNGWSYFNTTFLALVGALTQLAVDPLIKTFYLLRVFHGQARHTGMDLRLVLARERTRPRRLGPVIVLVVLAAWCAEPRRVRAAEPPRPVSVVQSVSVPQLNDSLDRVLQKPDFRWRLRPRPVPPSSEKEGIIKGFVRSTFDLIAQMGRTVWHWAEAAGRWLSDLWPKGKDAGPDAEAAGKNGRSSLDWMLLLQVVAGVLLVAVVVLLLFVAWKIWRHNRLSLPVAAAASLPQGTPDLRDENVEASRLPSDGWLELARRQMAAGEWRLALRALFLATLARHAHEGLVSLAKFKTNLDYEVELRRRAHGRAAVVDEFHGRRRQFEEAWYGAVPASDQVVRDWLQRLEQPS